MSKCRAEFDPGKDLMVCECGNTWQEATGLNAPRCLPLPIAWIIEHRGHSPTLTHYASVAKGEAARGAVVTPYSSGWRAP